MADGKNQGTGIAIFVIVIIIGAVGLVVHYHAQATKANQQLLQSEQTQSQSSSSTAAPTTPTYTTPTTTPSTTAPSGPSTTTCTPPTGIDATDGSPEHCTTQGPSGVTSQNCYSNGVGGYTCNNP